MNGNLVFIFSPQQLVEEIVSNISKEDTISERQAFKLYDYSWVTRMVREAKLFFTKGKEQNSAKVFKRKDIERLKLEQKYINQFKLIQL